MSLVRIIGAEVIFLAIIFYLYLCASIFEYHERVRWQKKIKVVCSGR